MCIGGLREWAYHGVRLPKEWSFPPYIINVCNTFSAHDVIGRVARDLL